MDYMKDYIKALREDRSFDWISNHGHELSRYELIDIIKELNYAIDEELYESDADYVRRSAANSLEIYYNEEE